MIFNNKYFLLFLSVGRKTVFFYVSYAIPLVRPGILNSELELPLRLSVLHSIGGIICSRAGTVPALELELFQL